MSAGKTQMLNSRNEFSSPTCDLQPDQALPPATSLKAIYQPRTELRYFFPEMQCGVVNLQGVSTALMWKVNPSWQPFPHQASIKTLFWARGGLTWSMEQKMCASSCWKRRTRVRPVKAPDSSFLCRTPKSAMRRGSSLQERGR